MQMRHRCLQKKKKKLIFENATTLTSTAPTSISRHPNTFPNPSCFAGLGFSGMEPSVVPWLAVGLSPLSLPLGAARRKRAACSKNKSPDSNMMYLLWFPCRYTRNECIYYVGVCWNVNFESNFSQSIIISSLSESRNFSEREGLISVTVFKQFELGSFCKTIISFLLSQLNFAWG